MDEDFNTVPDANACWHELTRTTSGSIEVSAHHCSGDWHGAMNFGPLVFTKRMQGTTPASPYVGLYEETNLSEIWRPYGSLQIDAVSATGDVDFHVKQLRRTGKSSQPAVAARGQLARGGLRIKLTDSSGCKGLITLGAQGVTLTFDFDAYPTDEDSWPQYGFPCTAKVTGPGKWWLGDYGNEYNSATFGDSASPLIDN